jgi:polar amino acid transport system substrate-binding protein
LRFVQSRVGLARRLIYIGRAMLRLVATVMLLVSAGPPLLFSQTPPIFRWAGDAEGGAPYVEADPADPSRVVGFDVDVAELVARALGREPRFVEVAFASIDQSIARGDADIGLSGIEDTPTRRAAYAVTVPYYQFREVLSVRAADAGQFRHLADLRGRRVGTLGGTIAYEILLAAERDHGLVAVSYEDDLHPYSDLLIGRLDAVLLDNVLANRRSRTIPGLATLPEPVAASHYVGVLARGNDALRNRIDQILKDAMRDGRLEAIYRKWNIWNSDQPELFSKVLAGASIEPITGYQTDSIATLPVWEATRRYLPSLLRAATITLMLSFGAMFIAVALGVTIATGRLYGNRMTHLLLTGYVELIRGTPLLLQLFVLYYGLAAAIRLPAFVAALLALALNYAAYESEIYRSALLAVPTGQLEASRTLGFTEFQTLRLIRGPQAFRIALAPMTNDFVALLKDSSLVSVLTVVELTKQTQIFATNLGSWVVPGAVCAGLYLIMSLPLAALARGLERRWRMAGVRNEI